MYYNKHKTLPQIGGIVLTALAAISLRSILILCNQSIAVSHFNLSPSGFACIQSQGTMWQTSDIFSFHCCGVLIIVLVGTLSDDKVSMLTQICLVQVQLRTEIPRILSSTLPGFELMTCRSWRYSSCH